jgi:hypothetical protein
MGRLLFITALLYCYGDPGFDSYRPASLDGPLHDFHQAINNTGRDAHRILVAIDDAVPKSGVIGDKLRRVGAALAPARN